MNYNREKELLETLAKTLDLMQGKDSYEIIVVDNASTDQSVTSVMARFPEVKLISRNVNTGIAGWNDGFAEASGEYLVVLDDDSNIEGGLDLAVEYFDTHPETGILSLKITGGAFRTEDRTDMQDCSDFIGCGAIIRKEVFLKIGGFAEWLFLYTHEWEYGMRCLNAGYKITYFEKCVVNHRASSINRTPTRLKIFSVRNELAIAYKFFNIKRRNLYLARIYLNNLKGIRRYGISSIPWYYKALKDFIKLKKQLDYTPVTKEIEDLSVKNIASARPFLNIL